jgi:lantibiotic modifying enzyme
VSFLAELVHADADPRAPALLESTVRWLWAQVRPSSHRWRFPYTIHADTGYAEDHSRLAWCYGDLGVSLALLNAARSLGNREWEAQAIEVALHAAHCDPESPSVCDATLCHGAAGNAHLFNRLFQATRCARFEAAALSWFRRALAFRDPGKPFGGYVLRSRHAESGDHTLGFLQGVAGIGLALLAGTSALAPDWDRVLLVSVAPS